jgi:hypothetical protein
MTNFKLRYKCVRGIRLGAQDLKKVFSGSSTLFFKLHGVRNSTKTNRGGQKIIGVDKN